MSTALFPAMAMKSFGRDNWFLDRVSIWAALLLLPMLFLESSPALAKTYVGHVVGVTDGDTISVLHNGTAVKVRLAEIDCPEKAQAFGTQAKKFTAGLTYGHDLKIVEVSRDRYGRTVALAYLSNGKCLNEELVSNGFAWCYRQYCKNADMLRREQIARDDHRGLWREKSAMEPAIFRRQLREQQAAGQKL